MSKRLALFISSFAVGLLLPSMIVGFAWKKVIDTREVNVVVEESAATLVPSTVDMFTVDYDQYGDIYIGESFIRCKIANNAANFYDCNFYLEDTDGNRITDEHQLKPGGSESVITTTFAKEEKGSYDVVLKYEIINNGVVSQVECPYTILVNERR